MLSNLLKTFFAILEPQTHTVVYLKIEQFFNRLSLQVLFHLKENLENEEKIHNEKNR